MTRQEVYDEMKRFLGFGAEDAENLKALRPILGRHQQAITEHFYEALGRFPETAKLIAGRVDALKRTHGAWFNDLLAGDYGPAYLESRWRIGMAHVRIGMSPYWVEVVMSIVRQMAVAALANEIRDPQELGRKCASLLKVLDLDLLIINLAYQDDRMDRLARFTGMKRALIENVIKMPEKK
jgi:hemoglobin-like flavoprotein